MSLQDIKLTAKTLVGQKGEEAAAHLLSGKGYAILARNWRPQGGQHRLELDIVAEQQGCLVFVEVKTRMGTEQESFSPLASFTRQKQQNMVRAASEYLAAHKKWAQPCRFDVISVILTAAGAAELEHFEHVIESGNSVDRCDASWQPW